MKKSKKFRPDYQVGNGGADGVLYKPEKLLTLPEGGLVCLMHEIQDDCWLVFSLDAKGVPARSKSYRMKSVGNVMWRELCNELTASAKDALKDKILGGNLTPQERGDAAVELARLHLADDELTEGIRARAEQFVKTHTPEETEAYIRQACETYREQTKAAAAGDAEAE